LAAVPESLLAKLKQGIVDRRIDYGMTCLQEHDHVLLRLDPKQRNAGLLVGYLAQWVDIGFDRPARVEELLSRFPKDIRADLPLSDYVYLRMAEGMLAMNHEASHEALAHFDVVLALGGDLSDKETLAVANFWKARCLRKIGEYDEALTYTLKARTLALELGYPRMAAVICVLETWLLFQKGKSKNAEHILRDAEETLRPTDDFVTLGNIHSSYGRMARREGDYDKAIQHFTMAIGQYRKRGSQHPHLARTLANIALVKRLVSLQLGKRIDAQMKRRRKAAARGRTAKESATATRSSRDQLRQQAFTHLEEAAAIYQHNGSNHGVGTIHLVYGYFYLDDGDFERAEEQATLAFELAEQKSDYIIMSRVRLLQCMIENAKVEDGIGERADPETHATQALTFAQDAIRFAKQTQNRRVLANAYAWEGLTFCNAFLQDWDAARKSHDAATVLVKGEKGGQLWDDLQALKTMLLPRIKVDDKLRAWSQGSVGEKSFQQILEEFAELIIPKVWESEGRRISRVAERLAISPKKVRRILDTVGARNKSAHRSS
jgi:tetratricopeptide (TPR) repeat protein